MYSTDFLDIPPLQSAGGSVRLPGSKSISNRVLLLAALSQGTTLLHGLLDSDDTRVMLAALQQLGCAVQPAAIAAGQALRITGLAPLPADSPVQPLFLGNAGTAMRPLTAVLALLGGSFVLDGVARMRERPIGDLVDALRPLGCRIDYLGQPGYPPLRIGVPDFSRLGDAPITVRGDVSSQFLTALLMALPLLAGASERALEIEVLGELISRPYIHITLQLLRRFGVLVHNDGWRRFRIPAGSHYQSPGVIHVEADASSASYFIALGAIAAPHAPDARGDGGIRIQGVGRDCMQGDIRFAEAAQAMGARIESGPHWLHIQRPPGQALQAIDLDCNHMPDAAMTLAVMALYAQGTTTLRNIASWRVKETDRLTAMAAELRKLGACVEEGADFLRITAPATPAHWRAARIKTYDDHRIAMCFALAAFNPALVPVRIEQPQCVAKTFPDYFETLFSVCHAPRIPVICIDGPSASGKGTVAAAVARALGYALLDSGALYRATALAALRAGLAPGDAGDAEAGQRIASIARSLALRFDAAQRVWLNGEDVSTAIRSEAVGMCASRVAALPAVRGALVDLQRSFARLPGLVADGRDMGTAIFPAAALKVYLSAPAHCRAERRQRQLKDMGVSTTMDALLADLEQRDAQDMQRENAPLRPAKDSLLLDSARLTADEAAAQVLSWWQERQPFETPSI